jgi:predicted acetyltransferase
MAATPAPERAVRTIAGDDDLRSYLTTMRLGFLSPADVTDDAVDFARSHFDPDRTWVATDDGQICGTARTFASTLHAPGGELVPASCLTQVTVRPTHTRRGHLSRLMAAHLAAATDAGEIVTLLIAAEWPIYGRFGFGPVSEWSPWQIERREASVLGDPVGTWELIDAEELDPIAETLCRRNHEVVVGSIGRPPEFRRVGTGAEQRTAGDGPKRRVRVLHRDEAGRPDGFAVYDATEAWDGMRPAGKLEVVDVVAVDRLAERELWRYLLDVDLVTTLTWEGPPHAPLPHLLVDGRAAHRTATWDHVWARLNDVPAALVARRYLGEDRVVIEVVDPLARAGGRFVLDAGLDGSTCDPTTVAADVVLPLGALGAAWLGTTDLRDLAGGGSVEERTDGAVDRLARLLRSDVPAWCPTSF